MIEDFVRAFGPGTRLISKENPTQEWEIVKYQYGKVVIKRLSDDLRLKISTSEFDEFDM